MKVSVIMNCLNCTRYLREAVDSVYAQTHTDWEIILWDNASTSDVRSVLGDHDGRLRYFRDEKTVPLGEARNLAIAEATGEFIAFLDCDDVWLAEKLARQIPVFAQNPIVGIVLSNALIFNDRGDHKPFYGKVKPPTGHVFRSLLRHYDACMSTAVIRRAALAGLTEWFDPRFGHVEEVDLFLRIAYTWHVGYVDEVLAKNRVHMESSTFLRPDLSPKETELMLAKFGALYPDFETRFANDTQGMRYYSQYYHALMEWKAGKNHLVRRRLRPFLLTNARANVPFFLSVFPYRLYAWTLAAFNSYVRMIPRP